MKISDLRQTEILKLSVEIRSQLLRESVDKAIEDEEIYMRICDRCESKDSVREYIIELLDVRASIYHARQPFDLCLNCKQLAQNWIKSFDRTFVKDLDPRMPQKEGEG